MTEPTNRFRLIALAGDVCLLLLFSAIGRTTHHDPSPLVPWLVAGTAAPFLIGWGIAGAAFGAFRCNAFYGVRNAATRVVLCWPPACALGIVIRSVLEGRLAHTGFILVALLFNLITLMCWRVMVSAAGSFFPVLERPG